MKHTEAERSEDAVAKATFLKHASTADEVDYSLQDLSDSNKSGSAPRGPATLERSETFSGLFKTINKHRFYDTLPITLCYLLGFITVGASDCLLGPTLLDLGIQVSSEVNALSVVFTVRALTSATGGVIGGYLVDKFPPHPIVMLSLLWTMTFLCVIPSCTSLYSLLFVFGLIGLGRAVQSTSAQVQIVRMHGGINVKPYIQSVHMSWAIGASISPLFASIFINKVEGLTTTSVGYAYYLAGAFLAVAALWTGYWVLNASKIPSKSPDADHSTDNAAGEVAGGLHVRLKNIFVGLTAVVLCLYVGYEATFGGFIFTYAVSYVDMLPHNAAYLTSVYWVCFCAGRFAGIFISIRYAPVRMLITTLCGVGLCLILMLMFNKTEPVIWLASGLYGLMMATIYPTAINLAEQNVAMTGKVFGILILGDTSGEMVLPLLAGNLMESAGPLYFLWLLLFSWAVCIFAFIALLKVTARLQQAKAGAKPATLDAPDMLP